MDILPEGLFLDPEIYNALISTLQRDCRVLESFSIIDYSLLIGIHNLDVAAKEGIENVETVECLSPEEKEKQMKRLRRKLVAHSTTMESIQVQEVPIDGEENLPPGGIPARNQNGERLLLFLSIIDILQSYRKRKRLEHTIKSIVHDGDAVSVTCPGFYAQRFLHFMSGSVFKKITPPLKHSLNKKGKYNSTKKRMTSEKYRTKPVSQNQTSIQESSSSNPHPNIIPGSFSDSF